MIDKNEVIELVNNSNSKNIICREFDLKPNNIAKMIAAVSNTFDGYVIIGASRDESFLHINGISNRFNYQIVIDAALNLLDQKIIVEAEQIKICNKNIIAIKINRAQNIVSLNKNFYIIENTDIIKVNGDYFMDKTKVFVVHGHDEVAKLDVARFIEKLGLEAIILHEKVSRGKTIIEKIEEYSNVGFAVVLYTPCDLGKAKIEETYKERARQNVVFEHGYLIGKIGRQNVCALVKGEIEKPNDISGVVYVEMDSSGAWKNILADEMKESGYAIDKNKM